MAASIADLREFLLQRGFSEPDADFIAALADDLRDGAAEQVLERVEERVGHFEAIFKEKLNGHETANRHEFDKVLSTIREVVANAQTANGDRFSEVHSAIANAQTENEKRFSEVHSAIANAQTANGDRFSELKGEVSELKGEVSELKGRVDGLQGQIDGLRSEMAGVRDSMDALRSELRGWVAQIGLRVVLAQAGLIGLIFAILGALGVFS